MKDFAADDLIILVTLAGDEDQIVLASLGDRVMDRLAAVGDLLVRLAGLLNSDFSIGEYLIGIFAARVINDDRKVALVRHALKSPRRAGAFLQCLPDHIQAVTERQAAGHR